MISFRLSKFIISGGLNTIVTYVSYLVLLRALPYHTSYTIAYISGIVLAYMLNRFFVFKAHQGLWSIATLPFIYLIQYFLGLLQIWVYVEKVGLSDTIAPLLALIISVPLTYFLSHLAFIGSSK